MRPHPGINTTSVAGEGFEGLPGLIMAIGFVFIFLGIFLPRNSSWPLVVFVLVEAGAAVLYILSARRNRRDSEMSMRALHQINDRKVLTNSQLAAVGAVYDHAQSL